MNLTSVFVIFHNDGFPVFAQLTLDRKKILFIHQQFDFFRWLFKKNLEISFGCCLSIFHLAECKVRTKNDECCKAYSYHPSKILN